LAGFTVIKQKNRSCATRNAAVFAMTTHGRLEFEALGNRKKARTDHQRS
jgi:hypothetical protein